MKTDLNTALVELIDELADELPRPVQEYEPIKILWEEGVISVTGEQDSDEFVVSISVVNPTVRNFRCSIHGEVGQCDHIDWAVHELYDSEIPSELEYEGLTKAVYNRAKRKKSKPKAKKQDPDLWKSQLSQIAAHVNNQSPGIERPRVRFPAGREAIYVVQMHQYGAFGDGIEVKVATRPLNANLPERKKESSGGTYSPAVYRWFTGGLEGWAASTDPFDRDLAEKVMMVHRPTDFYESSQQVRFTLSPEVAAEMIGRLAKSGRMFKNVEYQLHDDITPLSWLGDDKFDLKFEISPVENGSLALGLCAVSPTQIVRNQDFLIIHSSYFVDRQNRLGLFRGTKQLPLISAMLSSKRVIVPRDKATELIEKLSSMPGTLGIEFVGCDDVKPALIAVDGKPRVHVKASPISSDPFKVEAFIDYGGVLVPLSDGHADFYDTARRSLVKLDQPLHERCRDLIVAAGAVERRDVKGHTLTLSRKKLPAAVSQLIQNGWHVEAEGKLYRAASSFDIKVVSGIDWFELQGKAHFDQSVIDFPRLLHSLRSGERTVVLDDGSVGMIPEEWLKRFGNLAELATPDGDGIKFGRSQVGLLDALLAEQGAVNVDAAFTAARDALKAFDRIQPQEAPPGFVGELRPYQKLSQGWFDFLRQLGFGGCLADDMGLGKTIQVLALLEERRCQKSGPSLIVVPRSLIFNWSAEARKFAPQLRLLDQSHSQRQRGTEHLSDYDLILTTYGTLRRDAAFLKDFSFDYVVLDEAQAIKNPNTEAAKAARLLRGRHRLALSGTPIENHLRELWSLFDFLNPGMLGRVGRFAGVANDSDADQRSLLAAAVRPFILRRTKKQVAPELPDRVEQTVVVDLDPEQRRSYDELREYYRKTLLSKIETDGIGKSQIVILEALLRLRQAACHPGLIDKSRINEPSAKLDELMSRLTTALAEGERVLVFSQFTSLLAIVKNRLKQEGMEFLYLDGKTKDRQALVEQFQSGSGPAVFLISLKAGGVGLNLTSARTVYLLDPWWNPAVEAQAIDRAHRIGQHQTVFATRLIAADTVEQKVLELQAKKKGLADAIINADNASISSLTREDLELLLA